MNRYLSTRNQGLSLLEVLVGMLVLAFGILGLAPMIVLSINTNSMSRDYSIASQLAKDKLEYYESLGRIETVPYQETEDNLRDAYSRSTFITDNTTDPLIPGSLCQVDVIVSWTDKMGNGRSLSYSTLMAKE